MDTVPKSRSQGKYINKVVQYSWFKTSAYYRYPEICRWLLCLFSLWECLVLKFSLLSWLIFIEEDIGCFIMWLWLALPWHHSFIVRHWLVFLWLQFVLFVILVRYPATPFVFPVTRWNSCHLSGYDWCGRKSRRRAESWFLSSSLVTRSSLPLLLWKGNDHPKTFNLFRPNDY